VITDSKTAEAFAHSWNNVYSPITYTDDQIAEWLSPLQNGDFQGKRVLELGCGSGAILQFVARNGVETAVGMDLGESVTTAKKTLSDYPNVLIIKDDMVHSSCLSKIHFDLVYCIGVLHHLQKPEKGFSSILSHTAPGGRFHCWVYGKEGNLVVRTFVEPIRRIACRLPWFLNKYAIALPLVIPFFVYSKMCYMLAGLTAFERGKKYLPLFEYMRWVSKRGFRFHHHVAFDQLVSPQTRYLSRAEIEQWLRDPRIEQGTVYIIHRNGNGWKFGGRKRRVYEKDSLSKS